MALTLAQWADLYSQLLAEHRALMREHRKLLGALRETPLYAPNSESRLYYNEEEEDRAVSRGYAPGVPDPFLDLREDEALLRHANVLNPSIDYS